MLLIYKMGCSGNVTIFLKLFALWGRRGIAGLTPKSPPAGGDLGVKNRLSILQAPRGIRVPSRSRVTAHNSRLFP